MILPPNDPALPQPRNSRPGVASFTYALFILGLHAILFMILAVVRWESIVGLAQRGH